MIKSVLLIGVGAAGALHAERLLKKTKTRISPRAVTDSMLDKMNRRLEDSRSTGR